MGIGQSKEGFSVFGIFNQCVSPMGKRLLRLWFRRPIINLEAIQDRQVSARSSPPPSVCKMYCPSCPGSSMGLAPVPTTRTMKSHPGLLNARASDIAQCCMMREIGMCLLLQDTIEALMRMPDVAKSLRDILRKVKDASRLLSRLQVGRLHSILHCRPCCWRRILKQ